VHSSGGRFGLDDDGLTPNTQATTFTYADGSILTFGVRNLGSYQEFDGGNSGNSFLGTKGFYVFGKGFYTYKQGKMSEREAIPLPKDAVATGTPDAFKRFFDAVRSRKPEDLPMSVAEAHTSCVHFHLANIAFRAGRSLDFDPRTQRFKDNSVNHYLAREYRKGSEVPQVDPRYTRA
jgi:hypothetical protein